jgi:SAM-dependent methyltransferase
MILVLAIILAIMILLWGLYSLGFLTLALYFSYIVIAGCLIVLFSGALEVFRVIFRGNAPYVRSSSKMIKRILQEIDFREGAIVYDLGCGDGRFLRELVRRKKVRAVGYEYFFLPYALARIFNFIHRKKIKIYYKNFFKADLSDADYVFCYLIGDEMKKLEEKLQRELKPGAFVVSNTFAFKNWQLERLVTIKEGTKGRLNNNLYIYRK